jgi:SNF2 family DNA or RNA helicase
MGLEKIMQAIATGALKKQLFGFRKALIVCPATLKSQWKKEIEKFSGEKAFILSGLPEQRERQYLSADHHFFIVNYETKTASVVKRLKTKHKLVIAGTPIENRLIDIYSIINTIDPRGLGPLWEFSWQHCLFDPAKTNKISGYYDLQHLNELLAGILLRREKSGVLSQLPSVQQQDKRSFENNKDCRVFLSTEAGGAGLNLQAADILINFELPWNPAKKNQRIGRIDRLGQKSSKLTIFNLISRNSVEQHIAAGLLVKQSLFEGVLFKSNDIDFVDFSTKGRSQFIQQIEQLINQQETETAAPPAEASETIAPAPLPQTASAQAAATSPANKQAEDLTQVLNSGMQFLAGLFKMSTGKDFTFKDQKIEVDPESGEVVMRFKMP